jgi:hypothetical protein
VDLAEARRRRRLDPEGLEARLPGRAELGLHAAAHEGRAHRRRVRLQRRQFLRVFLRQRLRHGGQELRHLHQRALQPAEHLLQALGMRVLVGLDAEEAFARDARRDAAHRARGADHPTHLAEERRLPLVVGHGIRRPFPARR